MRSVAHLLGLGQRSGPEPLSAPDFPRHVGLLRVPGLRPAAGKRRAETEEEKRKREKDEQDREVDQSRKRRDDDDDDDERDDDDPDASAARGRERARCAAIFASPHAAVRPDMAAHYAFGTDLTRRQALRALEATTAGHGLAQSLAGRMVGIGQSRPAPGILGSNGTVQKSWDAAARRAGLLPSTGSGGGQKSAAAPHPAPASPKPTTSPAATVTTPGISWTASAERTGIATK